MASLFPPLPSPSPADSSAAFRAQTPALQHLSELRSAGLARPPCAFSMVTNKHLPHPWQLLIQLFVPHKVLNSAFNCVS